MVAHLPAVNQSPTAAAHSVTARSKKAPGRSGAFVELRGDTLTVLSPLLPEAAKQSFAGARRVVRH